MYALIFNLDQLNTERVNALDVTYSNIGCAINQLAFRPYDWPIQVNNLMIVKHGPDQPAEIAKQFRLGNDHGC